MREWSEAVKLYVWPKENIIAKTDMREIRKRRTGRKFNQKQSKWGVTVAEMVQPRSTVGL